MATMLTPFLCYRRSRTPDVNDFADLYGIDLRPAAVLPRKVEIELTVIIRKSILADGTALQLQQKLGRIPSQQELADKLGLRSEQHLQLIRLNKQAAQQLMMRHNARLVVHVANKYVQWGVDLVDLVMVSDYLSCGTAMAQLFYLHQGLALSCVNSALLGMHLNVFSFGWHASLLKRLGRSCCQVRYL